MFVFLLVANLRNRLYFLNAACQQQGETKILFFKTLQSSISKSNLKTTNFEKKKLFTIQKLTLQLNQLNKPKLHKVKQTQTILMTLINSI